MPDRHKSIPLDLTRYTEAVRREVSEEAEFESRTGALLRLLQLRPDAQDNPDDSGNGGGDCSEALERIGSADGSGRGMGG